MRGLGAGGLNLTAGLETPAERWCVVRAVRSTRMVPLPTTHQAERASIALKRQAKRLPKVIKAPTGPDGSTLAVAIRIKGGSGVPPEVKKILASLRLNKIFHGVFLNLDSWVRSVGGIAYARCPIPPTPQPHACALHSHPTPVSRPGHVFGDRGLVPSAVASGTALGWAGGWVGALVGAVLSPGHPLCCTGSSPPVSCAFTHVYMCMHAVLHRHLSS